MSIRKISTITSTSTFGTPKGLMKILFFAAAFHGIFMISCKTPSQNANSASVNSLSMSESMSYHSFLPLVEAFTPNKFMISTRVPPISRSLASRSVASTVTVGNRLVSSDREQGRRWTTFHKKSHRSISSCLNMLSSEDTEEESVPLTNGGNDNDTLNFDIENSSNNITDQNITSNTSLGPSSSSSLSRMSSQQSELIMSSLGEFDPSKKIPVKREVLVGDPQIKIRKKEKSVTAILQELAAIQQQGPRKYCILGTRHCSYLHQQIIELL